VAVENALGQERNFSSPVPNCIYTFPEVASIGLSTEECIAQNLPITTGTFSMAHLGKAMAVNDNEGFTRIIRHRETDAILGLHMIGHNVTECIAAAGVLLNQRVKAFDLSEMIFAHPTISETLREAAEDSMATALHLPPRKMMRLPAAI
jgi:dihydrolipoamide dehydrogenase